MIQNSRWQTILTHITKHINILAEILQMKYVYILLVSIIVFSSCHQETDNLIASRIEEQNIITEGILVMNPFFGVEPIDKPQLLAPNLIASLAEEYNGTFSPDGKEFYYTTDIPENAFITFTELKENNKWSEPKVASFSGKYSDYDPLFSPDGSKLFFSSRRPLPDNKNSHIWYVEKINEKWGEPQPVTLTGSENNEYYSSITNEGTIYFNIWSTANIFKAKKSGSNYEVEKLPEVINANYDKGDPFISPNEDYLIFRGYRKDSYGRGDLYISFNINNKWTYPENLGEPINSSAHEMCPSVTSDGKIFIFASSRISEKFRTKPLESIKRVQKKYQTYDNGELNIYYMSASFINDLREKYAVTSNE